MGKELVIPTSVGDVINNVGNLISGLGLGEVSQDRFIARTDEVYNTFRDAGYNPVPSYREFSLGKSQVPNHAKNYQSQFNDLHRFIVARMNANNPGMGDYWATIQPSLPLVNQGNISANSLVSFKSLVKQFPPNTFNPKMVDSSLSQTVGAGQGQAYVQDGQVIVPTGQAGNGIASQIFNFGAGLLDSTIKNSGIKNVDVQVLPAVLGNLSGAQNIAAGGGIVVTGTVGGQYEFPPVTKNTSESNAQSTGSMPAWLLPVGIGIAILFLFGRQIKKLFKL